MAFGCQLPDRSGLPSAVRGAGPCGGQSDAAGGPPVRPRPCPAPGPCATSTPDVNIIAAATAAAHITVTRRSALFISPLGLDSPYCTSPLIIDHTRASGGA